MKLSEIYFYYDEAGQPFANEQPRKVQLADIPGAEYFYLLSTRDDGLQLRYTYSQATDTIWCDDGSSAPSVLTSIHDPVVHFDGCGHLTITGFEEPNLIMAGLIAEPYESGCGAGEDLVEHLRQQIMHPARRMITEAIRARRQHSCFYSTDDKAHPLVQRRYPRRWPQTIALY